MIKKGRFVIYLFFLFKIVRILTHTYGERRESLKKTESGVYSKEENY